MLKQSSTFGFAPSHPQVFRLKLALRTLFTCQYLTCKTSPLIQNVSSRFHFRYFDMMKNRKAVGREVNVFVITNCYYYISFERCKIIYKKHPKTGNFRTIYFYSNMRLILIREKMFFNEISLPQLFCFLRSILESLMEPDE